MNWSAPRRSALATAAVLAVLSAGACDGRSVTERSGRMPEAPRSPIAGDCWPLPTEVRFAFGHQVTQQYVTGKRWVLVIQWDRLGDEEVAEHLRSALVAGGFEPLAPEGEWERFDRPGYGAVAFAVTPLDGVDPDAVVRGSFRLDLPRSAASATRSGGRCTPIPAVTPSPSPSSVVAEVGA
jgi:hypothetical protein